MNLARVNPTGTEFTRPFSSVLKGKPLAAEGPPRLEERGGEKEPQKRGATEKDAVWLGVFVGVYSQESSPSSRS